jgi:SAM-dependent methyltransferase
VLHEERGRAESFGADAARYDRSRPSYPAALVDALTVDEPHEVLDIGCGTGIASRLFAARGCHVLGVEIDERMAAVAREHGIDVELGAFELWEPAGRQFDLVVSGQAWHWVDPRRGPARVAGVTRPGGRFGVFWNWARHEPATKEALGAVYARLAPGLDAFSIVLGNGIDNRLDDAAQTFRASGSFDDVELTHYDWTTSYTRDEWLDHVQTHSDHSALPTRERDQLLDALAEAIDGRGGEVALTYETWLVSGRRR